MFDSYYKSQIPSASLLSHALDDLHDLDDLDDLDILYTLRFGYHSFFFFSHRSITLLAFAAFYIYTASRFLFALYCVVFLLSSYSRFVAFAILYAVGSSITYIQLTSKSATTTNKAPRTSFFPCIETHWQRISTLPVPS
jgi:hypothetical protein